MTAQDINDLLDIKESYELPDRLLQILQSPEDRERVFDALSEGADLSHDLLRDYFQQEHSDRSTLKQDYTPDSLCDLIHAIAPPSDRILDVCSGTGALSIAMPGKQDYHCEELSGRVVPVLLLNLALRNLTATVSRRDVLTDAVLDVYKLTSGERYSTIAFLSADSYTPGKYPLIVSNPPYSLTWEPKPDARFEGFPLPPKSKADYAFVLDILSRLDDKGTAIIVLPHGVLFRGASEGEIRKKLIEDNNIDAIIGLPEGMFLATDIPVFLLVLKKNRERNDLVVIDASKLGTKIGKQRVLKPDALDKISGLYKNREASPKLSSVVDIAQLREQDYNLNIPRYVDTSDKEPLPDLATLSADMAELDREIARENKTLAGMIRQLTGGDPIFTAKYRRDVAPMLVRLEGKTPAQDTKQITIDDIGGDLT